MKRRNFLKAIAASIAGLFVAKPILGENQPINRPVVGKYIIFAKNEYLGSDNCLWRSLEGHCDKGFAYREFYPILLNLEPEQWHMQSELVRNDVVNERIYFYVVFRKKQKV